MLGNTLFLSDYSVVLTRPVFRCPKNIDFTGFFYVFLWQRSFSDGAFAVGPGPDGLLSAGPPLSLAQVNEIVRHLLGE